MKNIVILLFLISPSFLIGQNKVYKSFDKAFSHIDKAWAIYIKKPIHMYESSLKSKIFVQIKAEVIFDPQLTFC